MASFEDWIERVKELAGEDYAYYADWYSFRTAYESGMTPEAAYKDCVEWMES